MRPLTPDEEQVIAHGATEPPFSGRYWNHKADGTYACRRCGATLYRSGDKFDPGQMFLHKILEIYLLNDRHSSG